MNQESFQNRLRMLTGFCILAMLFSVPRNSVGNNSVDLKIISNLPLEGNAHSVTLNNNLAYVSMNYDGMAIVDVSDPANPRLVKQIRDKNLMPLYLIADGDKAYEGDRRHGFQVLDIHDPLSPRITATIPVPPMVVHIHPHHNYLYLSCGARGIRIYEKKDTAPFVQPISRITSKDFSRMSTANDSTLFIADGYGLSLKIMDINTPTTPTLVNEYSMNGICDILTLDDETLYVSKRQGGILITDSKNPGQLRVLSKIIRGHDAIKDMKVVNDVLYIACNKGLELIDVSNRRKPTSIKTISTKAHPHNVCIREGLIYVADWKAGLTIIRMTSHEDS